MKVDDRDLDRSIAALYAERTADGGEHRDADGLCAYLAGELPEAAAEQLRDHLEGCHQCVSQLLDLEPLATPDVPPAPGVADHDVAKFQRAVHERLAGRPSEPADERVRPRPARRPTVRWSGLLKAAAAVFLVTALGLSMWVIQLQRTVADQRRHLEQPRLNVPVFYAEATRDAELVVGELPPGNDFFVLMLMPTELRVFASYEMEIRGAGERLIWNGEGLEMSAGGALRLGLSRRFLPPGSYRIHLYGLAEGGDREPIEEYPLKIR